MGALHILYGVLIAGSLIFGLEALLIGLGGRVTAIYKRDRLALFKLAIPTGLIIVSLSIIPSTILSLEPLYLCASVLLFTFIIGKFIGLSKDKLFQPGSLPSRATESDAEIESILKSRGLSEFIKKGKRTRKRERT